MSGLCSNIYILTEILHRMAGRIRLLDLLHKLMRHLPADLLCFAVRALELALSLIHI